MRKTTIILTGLGILVVAGLLYKGFQYVNSGSRQANEEKYAVRDYLSGGDSTSFERAELPANIQFPDDFGPHPEFQTEWWYYTGNLATKEGRQFGYELTIFRSGMEPGRLAKKSADSEWRTQHIFMAHLALADIENEEFYSFDRYSREATELAGARSDPFAVWLENWRVTGTGEVSPGRSGIPVMQLTAEQEPVALSLTMKSVKPAVLQGDNGLDPKGPEKGNASYYFSLTRLNTSGTVQIGSQSFNVTGTSWMDREWSTSALGESQVGWDWFALQLSNDHELMYYRIRNEDGTSSEYSSGVIVDEDGDKVGISKTDIELDPLEYWKAPSGARYPIRWDLTIPEQHIDLTVIPKMENQELQTQFKYWEGAVRIEGTFQNQHVEGDGYVELTGYGE